MKELTRTECADWLLERDRFVLLSHRKPDGDTIGSAAALCRGLRQKGKTAHEEVRKFSHKVGLVD